MKRNRLRIVVPVYPAFNIYSRIASRTTALGPVCVASAVNDLAGWDAEVIDENNLRRHGPRSDPGGADHELLQQQRPADVVGFYGGLTSTIPRLYSLARFYKGRGVVTVAGGQHFVDENIAEALSSGIDYVVLGEAEETMAELLRAIETGGDVDEIRGIAYLKQGEVALTPARAPLTDFDRLPFPDFSLVRYANIEMYPVGRIRGCCMNCEFCTVKGKPRCASVERLLENISHLVETYSAKHFFVVDDLFGQERDETVRFCRMLKDYQERIGRRLMLTVQIRLDKAKDTELLTVMRQAGIRHVAIGFESPIEEELRAMNKHIDSEEMLSLVKVFHRFGFWVHGMFIFGYPLPENVKFTMSVQDRVKAFRTFIKKARIDTIQVLLPAPLPGTELRRRLERQHRVYPTQDVGWEYYDGNFPLFEPDEPMTALQMQHGAKRIMGRFYRFPSLFLVIASILSFPMVGLYFHNLRLGWRRWYRHWEQRSIRFGGWLTMKKWTSDFSKGDFPRRLEKAKEHLSLAQNAGGPVRRSLQRQKV